MRIALIIGGIAAAVAVAVVVVGALLPVKHRASRSAAFSTTPERLFPLLDGPQRWRSDLRSWEPLPEEGGRRRWRETDAHGSTIAYEVVEREEPTRLTTRIATPGLPFSGTWTRTLEFQDGVTVVRVTEDGEVYNPVFRFVSRFVIGHTSGIERYLQDLGTAIDQPAHIQP
jgi:polyketide cyclase/dehydrase/lipid transport protein